jgi:hypothetical protein
MAYQGSRFAWIAFCVLTSVSAGGAQERVDMKEDLLDAFIECGRSMYGSSTHEAYFFGDGFIFVHEIDTGLLKHVNTIDFSRLAGAHNRDEYGIDIILECAEPNCVVIQTYGKIYGGWNDMMRNDNVRRIQYYCFSEPRPPLAALINIVVDEFQN